MARWYRCTDDCGASYRSERAAVMCCDRQLQAAVKGERRHKRACESPPDRPGWTGFWEGP